MFTICRGRCFRCLVSSVISLYLILNTFVYATEIFPRVFCHGNTQSDIHPHSMQDEGINTAASDEHPMSVSGSQYQAAATGTHDDFCPDCKSSFGHHLTALLPLPVSSLPDLATPEIETTVLLLSEYRDSLTPPPPKPLL